VRCGVSTNRKVLDLYKQVKDVSTLSEGLDNLSEEGEVCFICFMYYIMAPSTIIYRRKEAKIRQCDTFLS